MSDALKGMQPQAHQSLHNAILEMQQRGIPVHVNSGYRSPKEQEALYQKALAGKNPYPVAPPGQSKHQLGIAADLGIPPEHREAANSILAKHGWAWAGPPDAVHYDFTQAQAAPGGKGKGDVDYDTNGQGDGGGQDLDGQGGGGSLFGYTEGDPVESYKYSLKDLNGGVGDPPRISGAWVRGAMQGQQDPRIIDPAAAQFVQGNPSGQDPRIIDPAAAQFVQKQPAIDVIGAMLHPQPHPPAPNQNPENAQGILGNAAQYWGNWGNDTFNLLNGATLGQRFNSLMRPLSDAADMLTFNGALNPLRYTVNPALQGLTELTRQSMDQSKPGYDWGKIGQVMSNAFQGKAPLPFESPGIGHAFFGSIPDAASTPGLSPLESGLASFAHGVGEDLESLADIASSWEVGGRIGHTFFKPVLAGAGTPLGKALGARIAEASEGSGIASKPLARIAGLVDEGVTGMARRDLDSATSWAYRNFGDNKLVQSVLPALQRFSNSGADFRAGLNAYVDQTRILRSGQALLDRVNTMFADASKKAVGEGTPIVGDALQGTQWDLPENRSTGLTTGNTLGQLINLYREAGSQGSFLTEPEVLQQASKLGFDPQVVIKIGDTIRKIDDMAGQGLVKAGLMDPQTFAEGAGTHALRSYKTTSLTAQEAALHAQQMAANGFADTPTFAVMQNIQENGGTEASGGGFPAPPGLRDVVKERSLLTPEDRIKMIPDLDLTNSLKQIRSQLQEVAKANIYKAVGNPDLGLSLASKLSSDTWNRGPVTEQPRFQGELARNTKQLENLKQQFEGKGGINDQHAELSARFYKAAQESERARMAAISHEANEPQMPQMPGGTTPTASPKPGALQTAEEKVAQQYQERITGKGTNLTSARNRVGELKDQASLNQYAKDLRDWQKAHKSWSKTMSDLGAKSDAAVKRLYSTQAEHDAHIASAENLDQKATELRQRNEILSGSRTADLGDADRALSKAMDKVKMDPQALNPATRAKLNQVWLEHWDRWGNDIWHDIPPKGLPHVPAGLDPEVIRAMGANNPLIAAALNPNISLPGEAIDAKEATARGMTLWQSQTGDYGAMEGRWASAALKSFIDDQMDPNRFLGTAKGPVAWASKFLGEMMRTGKLYTNPVATMNVFVQSIMDNAMTAAEAGKAYNPIADRAGRQELLNWVKGGEATPTVKALLEFGNEISGGVRHGVDPFLNQSNDPLAKVGLADNKVVQMARNLKAWMKNEFVREQVVPKAGLVKMLMDQGVPPQEAAMWAEKAHGGSGVMGGGLETPGIMQMAENLNRTGAVMFTSYPLHSISRLMEMMVTRPDLVMRWPILRNYLLNQSGSELQQEARQHNLDMEETAIPTTGLLGKLLANPGGSPGVINMSNMIPYGAAFGGFSPTSLANPFLGAGKVEDASSHAGLNPDDVAAAKHGKLLQGYMPGTIDYTSKLLDAIWGRAPHPNSTMPQTPLQAMTAFAGVPMRHPETALSEQFSQYKKTAIQSRVNLVYELDDRYARGLDSGENIDHFKRQMETRDMDPDKINGALRDAQKEIMKLTMDRSLTEGRAKMMIRRQSGYIHALMQLQAEQSGRGSAYAANAYAGGTQ